MSAIRAFRLLPDDPARLAALAGPLDAHLRLLEQRLGVEIGNRGTAFHVTGHPDAGLQAEEVLRRLWDEAGEPGAEARLDAARVHLAVAAIAAGRGGDGADAPTPPPAPPQAWAPRPGPGAARSRERALQSKRGAIRGRGPHQVAYLEAIASHDLCLGIGPAGTGKTYLAVACAAEALAEGRVSRLVLVRPAVEAGEKLGFLPGDLSQKVDPYLRPLYDALHDMLGVERVAKLVERGAIEVAPLAYMRGRTLSDAFVILDEAQNTTVEQMKMFLTRLGFGTTAVVTGDTSQVDLPRHVRSGLVDALEVLEGVEGVSVTRFDAGDVVRHPLVARIVRAYDARDLARRAASPRTPGPDAS